MTIPTKQSIGAIIGEAESEKFASATAPAPTVPLEEVDEDAMMAELGFAGFASTKGQKVADADVSAAHVRVQRTYRQFMNRRGKANPNAPPTHGTQ